jgi:hypothetical protein
MSAYCGSSLTVVGFFGGKGLVILLWEDRSSECVTREIRELGAGTE